MINGVMSASVVFQWIKTFIIIHYCVVPFDYFDWLLEVVLLFFWLRKIGLYSCLKRCDMFIWLRIGVPLYVDRRGWYSESLSLLGSAWDCMLQSMPYGDSALLLRKEAWVDDLLVDSFAALQGESAPSLEEEADNALPGLCGESSLAHPLCF